MKELPKQEIIEKFIKEATAYGDHYLETGYLGYKKGNKLLTKVVNIFHLFYHDLELSHEILSILMDNENDYVRTLAAGYAIHLGLPVNKPLEVLHEVAKRDDICGSDAREVLWVHLEGPKYQ
jgi:hypothetical protein